MPTNPLQFAKDALNKAIEEKRKNQELIKSLGPSIVETLKPIFSEVALNSKLSKEELLEAISGIIINVPKTEVPQAQVEVKIPEIKVPQPIVNVTVPDIAVPQIPEVKIPKIVVPKPEVTVNVPEIKIPNLKWPDEELPIKGWVQLMGVSMENPLPVQLRDASGKPLNLFENLTTLISGGGSGGNRHVIVDKMPAVTVDTSGLLTDTELRASSLTVNQLSGSNWSVTSTLDSTNASTMWNGDNRLRVSLETGGSGLTDAELRATAVPVSQLSGASWSVTSTPDTTISLYNADNRLRVSVETGGSSLTDSELRATSVPVEQVSGSLWSVQVKEIFGSTITTLLNGDNRIPVSVETGGSGLTDSELRATAVPVSQVSGATWSVEVKNTVTVDGSGVTQPVSATNLDIRDLDNATDSVRVYQLSGASWSVEATLAAGSASIGTLGANSGVDIGDVTINNASGASAVNIQDGGNSITIDGSVSVSGSIASTVATGPTVADVADDGSAPVQMGGIARTANPTAVAGGDVVKTSHDDMGRILTRPLQVRDLTVTAYASLTNGTETTLLAASAGSYHDLVYVMGANNSDAAVTVDIRPVTAGNIVMTLQIPARGTTGIACPLPLPQSDTGNNWTADMSDITGTTVYLTGLFSREI